MADSPMVIRVAANLDELRKNLAEGKIQIETTTAAMTKLASSFSGERLIQSAQNVVAAVNAIGGASKLTEQEQVRVNATLERALEKYRLLGKEAPAGMQALADATKQAEARTSLLDGVVARLTLTAIAYKAAGFAAQLIADAGRLQDLTERTGISVEALQRFRVIAEQSGSSIEALATAVFQMGKRLAGGDESAASALRQLGLNFDDLRNARPEDAFNIIGKAIADLDDPFKQADLGAKVFGRSVAELIPVFKHLRDEVEPYVTLTAQQVRLLDLAGDAWVRLKASIVPAVVQFVDAKLKLGILLADIDAFRGRLDDLPVPKATDAMRKWNEEMAKRPAQAIADGLTREKEIIAELTKEYEKAQKAQEAAEAFRLKVTLANETMMAKLFQERVEREVRGYADIIEAEKALMDDISKNTLSSTDYQIQKIWEVADAQKEAFRGSIAQREEYNMLVNALATAQAERLIAIKRQEATALLQIQAVINQAGIGGNFIGLDPYGGSTPTPTSSPNVTAFLGPSRLSPVQSRAGGGAVAAGSPYVVGERGPELFVPGSSGSIVPGVTIQSGAIVINGSVLSSADQIAGVVGDAIMRRLRGQGVRVPSGA